MGPVSSAGFQRFERFAHRVSRGLVDPGPHMCRTPVGPSRQHAHVLQVFDCGNHLSGRDTVRHEESMRSPAQQRNVFFQLGSLFFCPLLPCSEVARPETWAPGQRSAHRGLPQLLVYRHDNGRLALLLPA